MALLKGNVRQIYFRYLGAAFGSALISSIYGLVDSAMVGQYQGPEGTAALAIVAPVWNIIYSLGLLTGIGGSVLLSAARGAGRRKEGDEYFTAALAGTVFFAAVSWLAIAFFDAPLLRLSGARDALLPLAQQYLLPVKFVVPLFLFNQMLAAFLRNDGAPGLATAAVLAGGVFNVFGDYFFVFTCDMGVFGAGKWGRIRAALKYALMAAAFFSAVWTLLVFLFPNGFIRIFMSPTGDILRIAPAILRSYGVSFLLLPLNIFSTYYFQSLMKPRASFSVSVLRGLVLSGALIYALPALLGPGAVWFAMPVTEAVTAVGVCVLIVRYTRPAPQTPE